MRTFTILSILPVLTGLFLSLPRLQSRQNQAQLYQEEAEDYYRKWLEEDAVYLITDEERTVFLNLTTPEEKEAFIEQFWQRRDPDPDTVENEFREEHYRRIAYANDHFSVGVPGWKSDRGRIYILHGEPTSIEYHDQGEQYYRTSGEGGGWTTTFAWQLWYYEHIPGFEDPVEIEFVDKTMTGHFVFAQDEMTKDAMLWVPGLGLTESERLGGGTKAERIGTRTMANMATRRIGNPLKIFTRKDDLFERLRRYTKLQAAPDIKFKDLEGLVDVSLYYDNLPFSVRLDLLRVTLNSFLAPVTFYFDTEQFQFKESGGIRQAKINVYGRVESLSRRKIYAFDDTVFLTFREQEFKKRSIFQRAVPLKPGRYKLVAIIKDVNSSKIGTLSQGIIVPEKTGAELELSSIILADRVQPAQYGEFITDPFILGGVKVFPNQNNVFERGNPIGFYFEVYNVMADQQTLEPDMTLNVNIFKDGKEVETPFKGMDLKQLLHRYSDRFFAGSMFNSQPLEPGRYKLQITVTDTIAQTQVEKTVTFKIV